MEEYISVYVTYPDNHIASEISRIIIEESLAACANVVSEIHSIYRWQGSINEEKETLVFYKTKTSLYARLEERIKTLHPYTCPCILAIPLLNGYRPYLDWIDKETKKNSGSD